MHMEEHSISQPRTPRVSILFPVFNGFENYPESMFEDSLARALDEVDSGLAELIIVDDASTDQTNKFLTTIFEDREGVTILSNPENFGIAGSLSRASRFANTDYSIFQTVRSYYEENSMAQMADFLDDNPAIGFVYGNTRYYGQPRYLRPGPYKRDRFLNGFPSCFGYMYRSLYNRTCEFRGYIVREGRHIDISDRDFLMQIIFDHESDGAWIDLDTLIYYYQGAGQMTELVHRYSKDIRGKYNRHFGRYGARY